MSESIASFAPPNPPDLAPVASTEKVEAKSEPNGSVPELAAAPGVPNVPTVPAVPDVPGTPEEERERKARLPRLTPPEGGWTDFPVPEFDETKYSLPVKKDFRDDGPYYENYRRTKLEEERNQIDQSIKELDEVIALWKECGGDKEQVEARQKEVSMKNKMFAYFKDNKLSDADKQELLRLAGLI